MASFQQSFPHFPQWSKWMDKSGKKWWKIEREQWNSNMNWGMQKFGYRIKIRIDFNC